MNELPGFSDFFAAWELFSGAVWSSVLVGMTLGLLGVYIVLGRMVFLTAALSQVAGLGVAATYYLGTRGCLFHPVTGFSVGGRCRPSGCSFPLDWLYGGFLRCPHCPSHFAEREAGSSSW